MLDQGRADTNVLPGRRIPKAVRSTLWFLVILAFLIFMWESYKVMWKATDGTIPLLGVDWLVDGTNRDMPHVWDIVPENGSTLGRSHQTWQLNEINALIWPSPGGIGVMDQALWDQTVDIATSEIVELEGVTIGNDAFRTDLAGVANEALEADGLDTVGADWQRTTVVLNQGGE